MVRVHDVRLPATGGSYAVQVGTDLTGTLVDRLRTTDAWRRVAIVADETVASLHGGRLREALRATGRPVELVTFAAGEASKTRQTKEQIEDRLFGAGLGRDSVLVALGGGVTIDLAGFVAATYMRGLPFVAIPTSVLAMLDSSIGGKTGVDVPAGKNLVGALHRPDLVLCDLLYLDTLPDVELRHGMAEGIKHALIRSVPHLQDLETSADAVLARNRPAVERIFADSVAIKIEHVEQDEREAGVRKALNFGHTFGHALERVSGWSVPHGEAVARGLIFATVLSIATGHLPAGTDRRVRRLLQAYGLPGGVFRGLPEPLVPPPRGRLDLAGLLAATRLDKKARGGQVEYVLLCRLGQVIPTWTSPVDDATVRRVLDAQAAIDA